MITFLIVQALETLQDFGFKKIFFTKYRTRCKELLELMDSKIYWVVLILWDSGLAFWGLIICKLVNK